MAEHSWQRDRRESRGNQMSCSDGHPLDPSREPRRRSVYAAPRTRRANYCTEKGNWFELGPKPIVSSIASHGTAETDARRSATKSPVVG